MKNWYAAVPIALAAATPSTPIHAADGSRPTAAEVAAVMAPIDAWFTGIATADAATIRAQMRIGSGGGATIVKRGEDGATTVRHLTWEENLSYVKPGTQRLREWFVKRPIVAIDGDIAMVWGEFAFSVDGRITHCGVDHFDLIREAGRWRVQNLTWSQRPCSDLRKG